jgi:hypothetical protein
MRRHCDGTDPNLKQYLRPDGEPAEHPVDRETVKACDCGMVFDDVKFMTIWPHRAV